MIAPDFTIRNRAELIDALSVAAQVEHVVLLEYLYAAFSCRHSHDAGVDANVQFTSWQLARGLYSIAHEEMDHLGAIQQLLAALGAPPVADAPPFPVADPRMPFPAELTRLDLAAVDRFITTESPTPPGADTTAALPTPPDPIRFDVLGDLYRAIVKGLEDLGDAVFLGAKVLEDAPTTLGFGLMPVATAADAIATITTVIREGEGSSGTDPRGHWQRFTAMRTRLTQLGAAADQVSWPCVPNPVLRGSELPGATVITDPVTVAVADIANRAYRALWLLLGGTYVYDWSESDPDDVKQRRADQRLRAMFGARWIMATAVRPLGEILARLPAFEGQADGPTAGMGFEQYGEFRVPAQPDARMTATLAELVSIADDLDAVAGHPALSAPWAGPRLAALAVDVRTIRERIANPLVGPPADPFEPPVAGPWLSIDFEGRYQARLATGGDPYNDPRGVSGWMFAYPGEPDLDRVIRFRPAGTHLRPHIDPAVQVGVSVRSASVDGAAPPAELTGVPVDLLDGAVFEGHNGVIAFDGDEPIAPLRLRIAGGGVVLERSALDEYRPPYNEVASLGAGFGDSQAAAELRVRHGLPAQVSQVSASGAPEPTPQMRAHLDAAAQRLQAAIAATPAADVATRRILQQRIAMSNGLWWPFGAVVIWRLRLTGSGAVVQVPDGVPAPATGTPWWLELLSTGFDQDAGCALVRGVLHAPLPRPDGTAADGPPPWRIPLVNADADADADAAPSMPIDGMGVRIGH